MNTVTEIVAMEVTPEEMASIIKQREVKAKQAAQEALAQEICNLIKQYKAMGGAVYAERSGKNHYISTGVNALYNARVDRFGLTFSI